MADIIGGHLCSKFFACLLLSRHSFISYRRGGSHCGDIKFGCRGAHFWACGPGELLLCVGNVKAVLQKELGMGALGLGDM